MFAKKCLVWGVMLGIALVAGTQILTWMGLGLSVWFVALTYSLVVVFVALGLRDIKRLDGGRLRMQTALAFVVIAILISRFVFQTYMFVYINYFEPDWVDTVAATWTEAMQKEDAPISQIDQRIATFRQAWQPMRMFSIEIVFMAIPQFVLGAITSMFYVFGDQKK